MIAAFLLFARKHKELLLAIGAAVTVLALINAAFAWDDHRIASAEQRGADAVNVAAAIVASRYSGDTVALSNRLHAAIAKSDSARRFAERRLRDHAATDRLYASLSHLSEPAKADSSVGALSSASVAVAAENDSLRSDVRAISAAAIEERTAADSVHQRDVKEISALGVVVVAARDTARVAEKQRDSRVKKTKVVAIASAALGVGVAAGKYLLKGKKL